jgi:hypothetical protein
MQHFAEVLNVELSTFSFGCKSCQKNQQHAWFAIARPAHGMPVVTTERQNLCANSTSALASKV